jgi:hypothetical protein
MELILPRDVSRCPGIDPTTKATCPEREKCQRYLAGLEDATRNDPWSAWDNFYSPNDLMACRDEWRKVENGV